MNAMTHMRRVARRRRRSIGARNLIRARDDSDARNARIAVARIRDEQFGREGAEPDHHEKSEESSAKAESGASHGVSG